MYIFNVNMNGSTSLYKNISEQPFSYRLRQMQWFASMNLVIICLFLLFLTTGVAAQDDYPGNVVQDDYPSTVVTVAPEYLGKDYYFSSNNSQV